MNVVNLSLSPASAPMHVGDRSTWLNSVDFSFEKYFQDFFQDFFFKIFFKIFFLKNFFLSSRQVRPYSKWA